MIGNSGAGNSSRSSTCNMLNWKERMGLGTGRQTLGELCEASEFMLVERTVISGSRQNTTTSNLDGSKKQQYLDQYEKDREFEKAAMEALHAEKLSRLRKIRRFYMMVIRKRGF